MRVVDTYDVLVFVYRFLFRGCQSLLIKGICLYYSFGVLFNFTAFLLEQGIQIVQEKYIMTTDSICFLLILIERLKKLKMFN